MRRNFDRAALRCRFCSSPKHDRSATSPKSELDQLLAQQPLRKVTAPLSSAVFYVNVRPGEVTDPETLTPLVELVDLISWRYKTPWEQRAQF